MDNDEEMIEDINDEIVSSEDTTPEYIEEQPVEDVPSNSNRGGFVNGLKDGYHQYKNNDKGMADRLQAAKNKKNTTGSGHIGTDIGNKLTGKNEEDKSGAEKLSEDVGGKVAGKGITAATGGLIHGKAAEELGRLGLQTMKDQMKKKYQKYFIAGGIIAFIVLMFVLILVSNDDDESESSGTTVTSYISGGLTDEELEDYLKYIGVCTDAGENYDELDETMINTADCKYAKQYFRKIKENYERINTDCTLGVEEQKDINSPCGIELNIPLLHETLSYGKSNDELWNMRSTPNQEKDIEELSNAMVEYVWESCYVINHYYTDGDGKRHSSPCRGCTEHTEKLNKDLYYFQLSFDKYISYLKYGLSSTHPYYEFGNLNIRGVFVSKGKPVLFGENHDHECVGPSNSSFDPTTTSSSSTNNPTQTTNVTSSNYCAAVYCANYVSGTAKEECTKGCERIKTSCAENRCKGLNNVSSSAYVSCMTECVH